MTITQPDTTLREVEAGIAAAVDRHLGGGPATASPRPVAPKAGGGGDNWGPSSQRVTSPHRTEGSLQQTVTSPLQMLAQVADHAQKLHEQMLSLTGAITGEAPPPLRLRQAPRPGGGLLPAIAMTAHEIEAVHIEIARLIEHLKGRL